MVVGNRAAAPPTILGSLPVAVCKRIKTSGRLLGSVIHEVNYHPWAQHGTGHVERRARKTFFVLDCGKLTESRLNNAAQARRYGGLHPWTKLMRPKTTRRYPR